MGDKIRIQVMAPEHSGKTSLSVLLARHLESLGAAVKLQRADPQLEEKLAKDTETLIERIRGLEITITEMQTAK